MILGRTTRVRTSPCDLFRLALTRVLVAVVLVWPGLAAAGPPLIADDPNTVGPGVVQPIFATVVFHQGNETLVRAPIVDLTVGLVESLDATLIVSFISLHSASPSSAWSFSGLFAPGLKWRFFRTERGLLAFSPAVDIDTRFARQPFFLLPVQGELKVGKRRRSVIGFDAGYVPAVRATDEWFIAVYSNAPATRRLNLLFELWSLSTNPIQITDVGASVGIDYGIIGQELRLIAALSTGLVSVGAPRIDIRAYLGTQLTFGAQ